MAEEKEDPFQNSLRIKDKNKEWDLFVMKGLTVLFTLILVFSTAGGSDAGPNLVVSSLSGGLEVGRESTIIVDLRNNASSVPMKDLPADIGSGEPKAICILAELQSKEDGIEVLSGPQNAGALGPGENRSVEFLVRAKEEAGVGIHPLELALSYSYLSNVNVTGDASLPDMAFHYNEASKTTPLEVETAIGPRIGIEEVKGSAAPGKEFALEVAFINRGDAPAADLQLQMMPQEPFSCSSCAVNISALAPGEVAQAKFRINSNDTQDGEYALPVSVSYMHADGTRHEELAALVQVRGRSWIELAIFPAALLLLLILLSALGVYVYMVKGRRKRRMPKRRR